jgi:hypothetical protein
LGFYRQSGVGGTLERKGYEFAFGASKAEPQPATNAAVAPTVGETGEEDGPFR